jgi:hypothetical protein
MDPGFMPDHSGRHVDSDCRQLFRQEWLVGFDRRTEMAA